MWRLPSCSLVPSAGAHSLLGLGLRSGSSGHAPAPLRKLYLCAEASRWGPSTRHLQGRAGGEGASGGAERSRERREGHRCEYVLGGDGDSELSQEWGGRAAWAGPCPRSWELSMWSWCRIDPVTGTDLSILVERGEGLSRRLPVLCALHLPWAGWSGGGGAPGTQCSVPGCWQQVVEGGPWRGAVRGC